MIIIKKHIVLLYIILFFASFAYAQNSNRSINALKFIKGIEINATPIEPQKNEEISDEKAIIIKSKNNRITDEEAVSLNSIEYLTLINFKYGQILNTEVEFLNNIQLYTFIEEWWNTRYVYGGETKSGVDCSGFTGALAKSVFGIKLPRTAREQYHYCEKISPFEMTEGDLVFFNTRGGISHVGVYLANNYFVHSSTSLGVTISNLNEDYYRKRFIGSGRINQITSLHAINSR